MCFDFLVFFVKFSYYFYLCNFRMILCQFVIRVNNLKIKYLSTKQRKNKKSNNMNGNKDIVIYLYMFCRKLKHYTYFAYLKRMHNKRKHLLSISQLKGCKCKLFFFKYV